MCFNVGVPKGLRQVLTESGIDTHGMKADEMREVLGSHPDFQNEEFRGKILIEEKKHIAYMLPKYHCELNPIERLWASDTLRRTVNTASSVSGRQLHQHWSLAG